MGGGGARWSPGRTEDIKRDLDDIKKSAEQSIFSAELAQYFNDILATFNDRDTKKIQDRLSNIVNAIKDEISGSVELKYGGSVAKHTYVDGLSDIDVLLTIDGSDLEKNGPETVRKTVAELIRNKNLGVASVEARTMTVTVLFDDGMEIQLLPTLRTVEGVKIPSASGTRWSKINPEGFTRALTKANETNAGKLIPTIKLVKGINANLPEELRLTGYHIESLAIESFKGYRGEKTTAAMLQYFFKRAPELVKMPIKDKTGQSLHVDDDLGPANSEKRKLISSVLDRVARRITFATMSKDAKKLQELFY